MRVARHSEWSGPQFRFCAKDRDTELKKLSWRWQREGGDIEERSFDCVPRRAHTARRKKARDFAQDDGEEDGSAALARGRGGVVSAWHRFGGVARLGLGEIEERSLDCVSRRAHTARKAKSAKLRSG